MSDKKRKNDTEPSPSDELLAWSRSKKLTGPINFRTKKEELEEKVAFERIRDKRDIADKIEKQTLEYNFDKYAENFYNTNNTDEEIKKIIEHPTMTKIEKIQQIYELEDERNAEANRYSGGYKKRSNKKRSNKKRSNKKRSNKKRSNKKR